MGGGAGSGAEGSLLLPLLPSSPICTPASLTPGAGGRAVGALGDAANKAGDGSVGGRDGDACDALDVEDVGGGDEV